MKFLALEGLPPGTEYSLGATRLTFGRTADCSIVLDDEDVSREHCQVLPTSDGYVIEDLGSRNGTIVDGQLIERATLLRPGSLVVIGRTLFEVQNTAEDRPPAERPQWANSRASTPAPPTPGGARAPVEAVAVAAQEAVVAGRLAQTNLAAVLPVLSRAATEAEARWVLGVCRQAAAAPRMEQRLEILNDAAPAIQRTIDAAVQLLGSTS